MKNNKNKQLLFSIIGIAILVIAVMGVTFAFFNYTRTGNTNTVQAGRIVFNSIEGDTINLENAFPITSTKAQTDTTNAKSLQVRVTGDTSYSRGIEYLVTATDVHMTTTTGKTVPLTIEVSVTGNNSKTLGTSDDDYYTNRGGNTSIYKLEYDGSLNENDHILVGYIAPDNTETGVDGILNIKAYFNDADILITDTPDTVDTTGKTVLSTTEWNSLKGNNALSFKIKVEAREGTWVEEVLSVNAMNKFPEAITSERTNIKEIYFNRMSSSAMQTAYDSATIKANITYNNEGKVLAWLKTNATDNTKYNLYVASDGKTYISTRDFIQAFTNVEKIEFNNIDTSRMNSMENMFINLSKLTYLDLSSFDTSSVTNMQSMFEGCTSLTNINFSSSFNTQNVTTFNSMFKNCSSLAILDLNNFDTSGLTGNIAFMFQGCSSLEKIYVNPNNWNVSSQPDSMPIFGNNTVLVGQAPNGTTYAFTDYNTVDKTYAVIATNSTAGYLTDISLKPAN